MRKISSVFLQVVVVLIGIGALALLLWEPHLEGRNVNATLYEIYFKDPFLALAYLASISFFVALYQAFKLLGYMGRNELSSPNSVKAFRTIKYCALILIGFLLAAEAYFFIVMSGKDDIAGGVMVGLFLILCSVVVTAVAAVFERRVQNAVNIKSDLPN